MNITSQIFHLSMLKAAQLQEQLALKLIQSATQPVEPAQTPQRSAAPEASGGETDAPTDGSSTVDIRV